MDDREIVARYLARDESAIRETAGKYGHRLRALAQGIVRDAGMPGPPRSARTTPISKPGTASRPTGRKAISTPSWPGSPGTCP